MKVLDNLSSGVAPLFLHIINTYFTGLYSVLVLYDEIRLDDSNSSFLPTYLDALQDALFTQDAYNTDPLTLHWICVKTNCSDDCISKLLLENVELGLQGYIIITSNIDRFLDLKYAVQQVSLQRMRDKIFLFMADHSTDLDTLFLNEAFDLYPNHLVIKPTTMDPSTVAYEMWTQQYVGMDNRTLSQRVGVFDEHSDVLFWDKMKNLMGRPLTVAAITYIPYTISYLVKSGHGTADAINSTEPKSVFYDGTEARIMHEFCRIRNCSLKVLTFIGDDWGGVFNNTGVGQIGAVFDHEVEFAIGCIYKWFTDYFDITQTIAKSAVTLLTPGAKPVSYALTPILPFAPSTWAFVFVSMNISIVLYYFIKFYSELLSNVRSNESIVNLADVDRSTFKSSFRKTYLEVVAIFLQQAFELRTTRYTVRLVYCVLLISGITLENAYSGGLKALLTIPRYEDKIETVRQYYATGFHWGAPHFVWALSLEHAQVPHLRAIFQRFEIHSDATLHNRSMSGSFGVAIERLHAGSYSFGDYVKLDSLKEQDVLREDLYYDYTVGYSVRGWPLMAHFDQVVMSVMECGLFNHWETETVNQYLDLNTENYLRHLASGYTENTGPVVLRVAHVYGPIAMLFVGICVAFLGFVGELVCHHTIQRRARQRRTKNSKQLN